MALRRCRTTENNLLDYIPKGITMLPNTSGARNAEEAVRIARLAREVCQTDFVKVEIEHESKYLLPDNEETIKATEKLAKEGFVVMPYMFPDPIAAKRLEDAGAACVMPLGAMIGSNKGLRARDFIEVIIKNANVPVIIDAGIGRPSQAAEAMEMGADAVMAYTAIASAGNIPLMARAFKNAIEAGREAYLSGLGKVTEDHAVPSSPTNEADYIADSRRFRTIRALTFRTVLLRLHDEGRGNAHFRKVSTDPLSSDARHVAQHAHATHTAATGNTSTSLEPPSGRGSGSARAAGSSRRTQRAKPDRRSRNRAYLRTGTA